ncbi:MAG: glycogen synthase [Trueperaceae bacterium]|nr:glycogen synthase [Trueperaceae bacterium]
MNILLASSEVYPFSKTGGLADVAGALPEALVKLGHKVLVVSPWYKTLKAKNAPLWIGDEWVPFDNTIETCGVGVLEQHGVTYAFIGHHYFQRDSLYGYEDDTKRFCLFTRAIPQAGARLNFVPDIIHANDWHTGYLPMLLEHGWHMPSGYVRKPSVFTIHNVQYQGNSGLDETLSWLRLPGFLRDSYMNYFGSANAMQAALGFAHRVTTVSPTYAEEIKTPAYGYGLDGTLRHISGKLSGIVNGIDTDIWNPKTDGQIAQTYTAKSLTKKVLNKQALCERFNLDVNKPIIAVVSRLVDQKGIDVFIDGATELLWQDWNVFVQGSGEQDLEAALYSLTARNPGRFASFVGYDEALAHLVYAGADTLAIPSRFEPCGLTQLIAMRYGTIPIARATGGLADTIRANETGFLFDHLNVSGLLWATKVARDAYDNHSFWQSMMKNAMAQDFSWERSAQAYIELYKSIHG